MTSPSRNVSEILKAAAEFLAGKGVEQPRLVSELLASRLLGCRRLELYIEFDKVLDDKRMAAMRRGVKRVAKGEPVQYVLGQTEFMGHVFKVDSRALIPRPETEVLVDRVVHCEALWSRRQPVVIDAGTGSGCVVISLALAKPDALYVAADVSDAAVELARENAQELGVGDKIGFVAGDLSDFADPESVDAIVANLPYVPTTEYEALPVHIREHEPRSALDGGPDGLFVIRQAVQDATIALKPGGFLFLEIGERQGNAVTALFEEAGFGEIAIEKDLADRDRVAHGVLTPEHGGRQ